MVNHADTACLRLLLLSLSTSRGKLTEKKVYVALQGAPSVLPKRISFFGIRSALHRHSPGPATGPPRLCWEVVDKVCQIVSCDFILPILNSFSILRTPKF